MWECICEKYDSQEAPGKYYMRENNFQKDWENICLWQLQFPWSTGETCMHENYNFQKVYSKFRELGELASSWAVRKQIYVASSLQGKHCPDWETPRDRTNQSHVRNCTTGATIVPPQWQTGPRKIAASVILIPQDVASRTAAPSVLLLQRQQDFTMETPVRAQRREWRSVNPTDFHKAWVHAGKERGVHFKTKYKYAALVCRTVSSFANLLGYLLSLLSPHTTSLIGQPHNSSCFLIFSVHEGTKAPRRLSWPTNAFEMPNRFGAIGSLFFQRTGKHWLTCQKNIIKLACLRTTTVLSEFKNLIFHGWNCKMTSRITKITALPHPHSTVPHIHMLIFLIMFFKYFTRKQLRAWFPLFIFTTPFWGKLGCVCVKHPTLPSKFTNQCFSNHDHLGAGFQGGQEELS